MARRKITNTDWKTIMVGIGLTGLFIFIRFLLTDKLVEWLLSIIDTTISLFAVGVIVFILNEIFGKRIIARLK